MPPRDRTAQPALETTTPTSTSPYENPAPIWRPKVGQFAEGGLLGTNYADQPLWRRLNWLHVGILFGTPAIALYGLFTTKITLPTAIFAVIWYWVGGLGITAGYHRLWAHKSYSAHPIVQVALMLAGSAAVQGSCLWWAKGHRSHHRHVDTDKDPYAATKGFWYAHVGWMLVKTDPKRIGRVEVEDLKRDKLVVWQHKYYLLLAPLMALVIPAAVAGLGWGDWAGGYYFAGALRLFAVHHATFCVNSVAHTLGEATYTDENTARDSLITALLTFGEGTHNYHHNFPSDFRNGLSFASYDPTKWLIWTLSAVGLTWNLQRFPDEEVAKTKLQMQERALQAKRAALNWGPDPATLPTMTRAEFEAQAAKPGAPSAGKKWVIIDGFVCDVSAFAATHPGGEKFIETSLGSDATAAFRGEVYRHSAAARNIAATLRVARIDRYWG